MMRMLSHRLVWLLAVALWLPVSAEGPQMFDSAQAAVEALGAAAKADDLKVFNTLFGAGADKVLSSGDAQADKNGREHFVSRFEEKTELVNEHGATFVYVGSDGWPFPIPLRVKDKRWFFDLKAGQKDLLARRIGANELKAISVCHSIAQAEKEYCSRDWDGDRVLEFAKTITSAPGKHNGLHWPRKPGGLESPLGSLVAEAQAEGYTHGQAVAGEKKPAPYHGYYFRILTAQGPHAPGGAYSYILNNNMVAGFAVLAWPARWGSSGVSTFILGLNGDLYQRNLGPHTAELVGEVTRYDPGPGWTLVKGDQ